MSLSKKLEELLAAASPGPWENPAGSTVVVKGRGHIADVRDPGDYTHQTPIALANARLAALAPDLARLVIQLEGALEWLCNDMPYPAPELLPEKRVLWMQHVERALAESTKLTELLADNPGPEGVD